MDLQDCLFKQYFNTVLRTVGEGTDPSVGDLGGYKQTDTTHLVQSVRTKISTNNELRRILYTKFILLWRGPLGKGINMPLPACVLDGVRQTFPRSTGM